MYDETAERIKAFNEGFAAGAKEEHKKFIDAMRVITAKIEELEDKHWEECRQIALYDDEVKNIRNSIFEGIIETACDVNPCKGLKNCRNPLCGRHNDLAIVNSERWYAEIKDNPYFDKLREAKNDK